MKSKLTFLLSLTFLFLFSGSVYGDDFIDGLKAYKRNDYKEAVRLFRLSAEQGNKFAQNILGRMYDEGQGVLQDYEEAIRLFRLSAEQGHDAAQYNLGVMYSNGKGVFHKTIKKQSDIIVFLLNKVVPMHNTTWVVCISMDKGSYKTMH